MIEKINNFEKKSCDFLEQNTEGLSKKIIKLIANYYPDAKIRKKYWKKLGVKMGENTYPNLGFKCTSNGENLVEIGANVSIGPNVVLLPNSNANNGKEINEICYIKENLTKKEKIVIKDEVWIGANVVIMPGVIVEKCCVIGAGSVVIENTEPYSIYAGVPAKKIKDLRK